MPKLPMSVRPTFRALRACPLRAAALATLMLMPAAHAQDKPAAPSTQATKAAKPASKAPAKSRANVMTRDELRACMDEQDRLQATRTRIDQDQAALEQQKGRIQAMDADRAKRLAALDPADEPGRKAIEEEVARRDQEAESYNAKLAALREQASGFDSGRQSWVQRCTTRDFDEMDEAAIKKERAQAARARK
jgi:hypothetical protein